MYLLLLKPNPLTPQMCLQPPGTNDLKIIGEWDGMDWVVGALSQCIRLHKICTFVTHIRTVVILPYGKRQAQLCTSPCRIVTNICMYSMLNFQIQTWEMATSQLDPLHMVNINSKLLTIGNCCISIAFRASVLAHPYMFVQGGGGRCLCVCSTDQHMLCVPMYPIHHTEWCVSHQGCGVCEVCLQLHNLCRP